MGEIHHSNLSSVYLLVQDDGGDQRGSDLALLIGFWVRATLKTALKRFDLISNRSEAFPGLSCGCTCRSGGLAVALDPVDLVGLGDVQLVAFGNLLEVGAFVEGAPEPGLPHGGVGPVPPLPELAFINSPGLSGYKRSFISETTSSQIIKVSQKLMLRGNIWFASGNNLKSFYIHTHIIKPATIIQNVFMMFM